MDEKPRDPQGHYLANDIVVPDDQWEELPQAPPPIIVLEFSQRGEGWPPRPRDQQEIRSVYAREIPGSLTSELEREILAVVLANSHVKSTLGERFAHINTDSLNASKTGGSDCAEALRSRVIFFSHTINAAVEVYLSGTHVQSVEVKKGYQPPEGQAEIQDAICLAREDSRIMDKVALLSANAILLPDAGETVGNGHRILWVTFTEQSDTEDEKPALFSAAVDLIDRTVLMARPELPIQAEEGGLDHA